MTLPSTLLVWCLLLLLLGIEFAVAHSYLLQAAVPFIGTGMAMLVALSFMRLGRSPGLVPIVAVAAIFWLLVMFGLGGLDSFTRHDIPVAGAPGAPAAGSIIATSDVPRPD